MSFAEKLTDVQRSRQSLLCIGIDPDLDRLPPALRRAHDPADAVVAFAAGIIEATAPYACAYKLNFAFFEALGADGWRALARTLALVPAGIVTIADAKRGDIGNSAAFYARAVYEDLGFNACTVSPYMGTDSITPFLSYPDRCTFVLARTSNPGGADLQELEAGGEKLYLHTARMVQRLHDAHPGEAGLVVGATDAAPVGTLRAACPALPFLIPGVGAQGGDPAAILERAGSGYGMNLINSSRQILYASSGDDFAEAAAREADALRRRLHALRTDA